MDEASASATQTDIDLSEPWGSPTSILDALASFDQAVAQMDHVTLGDADHGVDLLRAA